jgi:hypothetical protein
MVRAAEFRSAPLSGVNDPKAVLDAQQPLLSRLDSFAALERGET